MKKIILLLIIILCTGCYDYVEIEDTVIINGLLIDYIDNNYVLTSQLIINNDKPSIKTYKTEGKTIEECIYKLSDISNKEIFISHLKTLILTKNTINNKDYIDYFLRNPKSKMNFYIYYVDEKYKDKIFNDSSIYLNELINVNNKTFSSSTPLSFLEFVYKEKEYGIDNIYPNLITKDNSIYLENLVIFDKDNNSINLNQNNSIYFNMISNNLKKTLINFKCDEEYFSLTINKSKIKYSLKDNKIIINVSLKSKLNNYNCKYKLTEKNTIDKLNKIVNSTIKEEINNLINISKDNNIDFLGLNNYVYKHNYKNYKKYNLNNIETNIIVNMTINSIGEKNK